MRCFVVGGLMAVVLASLNVPAAPPEFTAAQVKLFEDEVKPLLEAKCYRCHGGEKVKGELRLNSREAVLKGGESGSAVDLKNPADSRLLKAINYTDGLEMPPSGKLSDKEIDAFTRWVKAGLPWSSEKAKAHETKSDGKDYWAYQPIKRSPEPVVSHTAWSRTPIDAFLTGKWESEGLNPPALADPAVLIRRMTYDLIGLPPTPEEGDAFTAACAKDRAAAVTALVDRLLASPHYGEKWGRHWLDVVRYAETNGYERDGPKPYAWRYRDYVIKSFNDDKPYDRFIIEQLAGDELPGAGAEAIVATGFYRLGLWDDEPADPEQALFDGYDDLVTTTGQAFLGMTLNCCRCHDHKIDPLPQTDYYRMVAFFRDIRPFSDTRDTRSKFNLTDISPPEVRRTYEAGLKQREAKIEELRGKLKPIEDAAIAKMSPEDQLKVQDGKREEVLKKAPKYLEGDAKEQFTTLRRELAEIQRRPLPPRDMALSVNHCDVKPPATHVLLRGNPHSPGDPVTPGFPRVVCSSDPTLPSPGEKSSGRRTVLAKWIASPENPLTARVMVNRVWQHHFGRGIVGTANDFGKFGERPTHPELLDYLADEFVRSGWSVKKLHRMILLSNAYQMSSRPDPSALAKDAANRWFSRFPMRRLQAEEVRDSMLAVSGKLDLTQFGPSIYPKLPKEVLAGQSMPGDGWHTSPADKSNRRSVYIHVKRSLQMPILATHDQADTDSSCPVRYTTTVPTQALGMLNGGFTRSQAEAFAERLAKELPDDVEAQIRRAVRLTTGRMAGNGEVRRDRELIDDLRTKHGLTPDKALAEYCLLALNANEFVYVD